MLAAFPYYPSIARMAQTQVMLTYLSREEMMRSKTICLVRACGFDSDLEENFISATQFYLLFKLQKAQIDKRINKFIIQKANITIMDIQYNFELSEKSRGILYRLKSSLQKDKISLEGLICKIFEFKKTKFNRKEFHLLIKKYDCNLILEDIDSLFETLDESKNECVFYEAFQFALKTITQDDNPSQALNRKSMIRFRENDKKNPIQKSKQQEERGIKVLIEVKDLLLQSEDYLEAICLFVTEKDGFLTVQNVTQILRNFQFNDEDKRQIFLQQIFQQKNKVSIKDFLHKLSLDSYGTRINLQSSQEENIIGEEQKSQFIKKQESSRIKNFNGNQRPNTAQSYRQGIEDSIHYSLENIPGVLQEYFNYGSELEEPFASFAAEYLSQGAIFIDEQNPTYAKARAWVHIAEVNPNYQLFQVAKSIIRRDKNRKGLGAMLQPKDIIQGGFGDCYFLSAVAAIVQDYPQLVYRLFVLQKNPSHIFGVKLFIDGKWMTIPVDGTFPINHYRSFCGAQPHHNQIWVMLLQKAWAKVYKSYQNIYSGYNEQGLLAISGAPSISISTKKEGFIRKIVAQFGKGSIITCATSKDVSQLTEKQQENLGVFAGHAYTLLKVYEKIPYKNSHTTIVKIRNPWGKKGWKGDWSFHSKTWTNQVRKMVGYEVDPQDGTFFVGLSDFAIYFDFINISKVNLAFKHSHISNKANRYEFYQNRFKVVQKGDYFFTIYQQNGRKYKNTSQIYQKSKSWLFLAEIKKKATNGEILDLLAIACKTSYNQNNTIQTTLSPGDYIIISKVSWKYWSDHPYNLTTYAPTKIKFSEARVASPSIISKFIDSRAQQLAKHQGGKISFYDGCNISKSYYFDHEDGVGFLTINNFDTRALQTVISLQPCKGIIVVPPFSLPLKLFVMPYETRTVGFIIDPEGYSYSLKEKYYLRIM